MSSFYLCDYCEHWRNWRPNYTGLEGRCTITEKSGNLFYKMPMHDGIENPTDVCEHYEPPRAGDADLAEPPALTC